MKLEERHMKEKKKIEIETKEIAAEVEQMNDKLDEEKKETDQLILEKRKLERQNLNTARLEFYFINIDCLKTS